MRTNREPPASPAASGSRSFTVIPLARLSEGLTMTWSDSDRPWEICSLSPRSLLIRPSGLRPFRLDGQSRPLSLRNGRGEHSKAL